MAKATQADRRVHGLPMGPLVKDVLKVAYRARLAALLEGPTGIGKSQIVAELAADLGIDCIVLDLSLLEPPDLVGLPVMSGGRTEYAPPAILPTAGAGILFLEELNRAERFIQQPALQLLTARKLHTYTLPDAWVPMAAINPEDGDYQVTPLDPALRARFLTLRVRADREAWLLWANRHGIHPAIRQLAQRDPHFLDDVPPRTWAYVSHLLRSMQAEEQRQPHLLRALLGGYLSHAWIEVLLKEIDECDATDGIDVVQLLGCYHNDAKVRKMVQQLSEDGRTDILEMLAYRLHEIVEGPRLNELIGAKQFHLDAFEAMIRDLPGDHRAAITTVIGKNPAGATLLNVRADEVLDGRFPGSTLATQVAAWAKDAYRMHRIAWLVAAVSRAIETHPKIVELRGNAGVRTALGKLLKIIGEPASEPLRKVLDAKSIVPQM